MSDHSHGAPPSQPPPPPATLNPSSSSSVAIHNHQAHTSGYDHEYTHRQRSLSQHNPHHQHQHHHHQLQQHSHPHPQTLEALHLAGLDSEKQFVGDEYGYHYHNSALQHAAVHHSHPASSQTRYDQLGQLPLALPTAQAPPPPPITASHGSSCIHHSSSSRSRSGSSTPSSKPRRFRLSWTDEETHYLMQGCRDHGVGNWKKILHDPKLKFNNRTAVDLKDRFRTSFPAEYSRLYPNARTHKGRVSNSTLTIQPLVKINRKERRSFTAKEDKALLEGFERYGPAWSLIQRDPALGLDSRRSTDLRDRFRNAYPDRYTAAGYKGRPKKSSSSSRTQGASPQVQDYIKKEFADSLQQPPHVQQQQYQELDVTFNRNNGVPPSWKMFYQSQNSATTNAPQIATMQLPNSTSSIPIHRQWESK